MDPEQKQFLSLTTTPARLSPEEAGWLLKFSRLEIAILVSAGLLRPLGNPPANGQKYFATEVILPLRHDLKWMNRASDAIYRYWRDKNARKLSTRVPVNEASATSPKTAA